MQTLSKISGVLKTVSAVAGVLSFIPVIGEIAAPIALATGAGALAIDASIKYATGQGSWKSIVVDGALMAVPGVGKLAGKITRLARKHSIVGRAARLHGPDSFQGVGTASASHYASRFFAKSGVTTNLDAIASGTSVPYDLSSVSL